MLVTGSRARGDLGRAPDQISGFISTGPAEAGPLGRNEHPRSAVAKQPLTRGIEAPRPQPRSSPSRRADAHQKDTSTKSGAREASQAALSFLGMPTKPITPRFAESLRLLAASQLQTQVSRSGTLDVSALGVVSACAGLPSDGSFITATPSSSTAHCAHCAGSHEHEAHSDGKAPQVRRGNHPRTPPEGRAVHGRRPHHPRVRRRRG